MFAVIKTGGKQYRVAADDVLQVEKVKGEPGEIIQVGDVLVVGGDTPALGTPTVSGASVAAEVIEQGRGPKVIAFKKRRRKNSRRKRGHRQEFTLIRITEILTDGAKPTKTARPKPERKPKPAEAASEAAGDEDEAPSRTAAPKAKAKAKTGKKPAAKKASKGRPAAKGKSKSKSKK
jgi:large subunit ribosomal protein L21